MPAPIGHAPYNKNGEGGRPTKFDIEDIERFTDEFLIWLKDEENIWFKDFCLDRDINPDRLADWATKHDRFRGVYELAKHRQESRLINGVLKKQYNNGMATLVLTNHHGYTTTKSETKISGDADHPLTFAMPVVDNCSKDIVNE